MSFIMDMVSNKDYAPSYEELCAYQSGEAARLWLELTSFIKDKFSCVPKVMYSKCPAKPGWNVKLQKGSKSYCTLYPEGSSFTVLVVLPQVLEQTALNAVYLTQAVRRQLAEAAAFNGTKWLMISVNNDTDYKCAKALLELKYGKAAADKE